MTENSMWKSLNDELRTARTDLVNFIIAQPWVSLNKEDDYLFFKAFGFTPALGHDRFEKFFDKKGIIFGMQQIEFPMSDRTLAYETEEGIIIDDVHYEEFQEKKNIRRKRLNTLKNIIKKKFPEGEDLFNKYHAALTNRNEFLYESLHTPTPLHLPPPRPPKQYGSPNRHTNTHRPINIIRHRTTHNKDVLPSPPPKTQSGSPNGFKLISEDFPPLGKNKGGGISSKKRTPKKKKNKTKTQRCRRRY